MYKAIIIFYLSFFVGYPAMAQELCQDIETNPLFNLIKAQVKKCRAHNVHLSFDDGPSGSVTPQILSELNKRGIKATFFVSTSNLEKSDALKKLTSKILSDKHTLGDHGYEHKSYDLRIVKGKVEEKGFSETEALKQIEKSVQLLNSATLGKFNEQNIKLFRFPYGRGAMPSEEELKYMHDQGIMKFDSEIYSDRLKEYRKTSRAFGNISDSGFSHLGWNHDSQDFKYTTKNDSPENVEEYVLDNVVRLCQSKEKNQVALFHDIKAINAKAIPLIVDIGKCLGLKFISAETLLKSSAALTESGVLIPNDYQFREALGQMKDSLDFLVQKLPSQKKCESRDPFSCVSGNGKVYAHCTGESSICFAGKWISREKAIEEDKCNLGAK